IIESKKYKLYALPEQIKVSRFEDINKIHSITEMIIKEYISLFYRQAEKKKTMEYLMVENLTKEDENLNFGNIILKISKTIAKEFKNLLMDLEKIYKVDIEEIPTIQYDAIKPKFGNGNHSKEEIEIILRRYLKK
ncbi:MAG: hypothetical protein ACE5KE_11505, partial [Methanosarcinales archaeon]